jgi:glyoxylase-like metal-dependent hydrolase (beta-lactamase superfamily II)/8-oxo-dGTP pyrophosphatase MutT (NUDIX family)
MAFAGGMHVFPGGRVDAGDASTELASRSAIGSDAAATRLGGDLVPDAALAAHIAAIRELWEESGILLADSAATSAEVAAARAAVVDGTTNFEALAIRLDVRLRTDLLQPLSRWVTPPGYPRRFDARFFVAVLPDGAADPTIASGEVVSLEWFRPSDALDAMADGRIGMWLPTSSTLQQLEHFADPADLARLAPGRLGDVLVDEPAPDVVRVVMPAGGGVAGQPVCSYLVGQRRFVLVDPGDPTGPALERCLDIVVARGGEIAAIALTQADPDHHGGAEGLAQRLGIPVLAGPGAARRLPYTIVEIDDGDVIHVGDVPLQVVGTPGPRPDHLCFLDAIGGVALTGDLDGRRGARMLPGPTDEEAWARSRARLDALGPNIRLGGHPA